MSQGSEAKRILQEPAPMSATRLILDQRGIA
jgi:hypothetical protein